MAKGGARVRSGPPKDPSSARSEKTGFSLTALPSEGFKGAVPAFPLPKTARGGVRPTDSFRKRETEIWRQIWKTPQACAWKREPYRWPTIGEFCRIKAAVELDPDSNAALLSRLREYRNEIGLSPDGLRANGWGIAVDQIAKQAAKKTTPRKKTAPTRRLRSVGGRGNS